MSLILRTIYLDAAYFQVVGAQANAKRASIAGLLIPVFLSLGTLLLYYALYQSRFLPRFISVLGYIGAVLILVLNLLLTFYVQVGDIGMILALPILSNEIFLGIRLIGKGFDTTTLATLSAKSVWVQQTIIV